MLAREKNGAKEVGKGEMRDRNALNFDLNPLFVFPSYSLHLHGNPKTF
jgi:hypothetical protein